MCLLVVERFFIHHQMFLWTSIPLSGEETCPCINGFLTVKALVGSWRYQNWRTLRITLKFHRTGGREQGHFCVVGGGKTKSNIQYDKLNVEYLMGAVDAGTRSRCEGEHEKYLRVTIKYLLRHGGWAAAGRVMS